MFRIKVPTLIASGVLAVGLSVSSLFGAGVASADQGYYGPQVPYYGDQRSDVSVGINVLWQNGGGPQWPRGNGQWPGGGCNNCGGQVVNQWLEWVPAHENPPWPCQFISIREGHRVYDVKVRNDQPWRQIGWNSLGNGTFRFFYL